MTGIINEALPITVVGAGSFGTAVAAAFSEKFKVNLWSRDPGLKASLEESRVNSHYLPNIQLSENILFFENLKLATQDSQILLFATPIQFLRDFLRENKNCFNKNHIFINLGKGIEVNTGHLPSQIFINELEISNKIFAQLSGPSFAKELAQKNPTGLVLACADQTLATELQNHLALSFLRIYTHDDVIGVELGGALKNIYAISAGICEGLGFGHNTRAGLITRCLHEMMHLGQKLGANPQTFSGLSGIGDLILTCTGSLSRNRQVGFRLGQGESLESIIKTLGHVAEGVATTHAVYELGLKLNLDLPNVEAVYHILYKNLAPQKAVSQLLKRELKKEFLLDDV